MISFFLFWEMTSVCSFLLIGQKHQDEKNRLAARKAMFITVGGGLFLLIAFVLIHQMQISFGLGPAEAWKFSSLTPELES